MRLIECYIQSFGKLSDFKFSFDSGMNTVIKENGYGKTTLSAFIKAMLYGLSESRKSDLYENERKRFLPWSSTLCGGWLIFSDGVGEYRIERSFGQKASLDSFRLVDMKTGKESTKYSENLGRELFGIDKDGFERTVCLCDKNLSGKTDNKSISEKMSNLTGTDADLGALDSALDRLDKQRRNYYKKGGSGLIRDTEDKIRMKEEQLCELEERKAELGKLEERAQELRERLEDAQTLRAEINKKLKAADEKREQLALLKAKGEAARALQEAIAKKHSIEAEFAHGVPSFDKIYEMKHNMKQGEDLIREAAASKPSDELSPLEERVGGVSREEIERARAELVPPSNSAFIVKVILSALLVGLGVLIITNYLVPGIVLTVLGLLAFTLIPVKKKSEGEKRARELLLRTGANDTHDINGKLSELLDSFNRYELLRSNELERSARRAALYGEGEKKLNAARDFLALYPAAAGSFDELLRISGEYAQLMHTVKGHTEEAFTVQGVIVDEPIPDTDGLRAELDEVSKSCGSFEAEYKNALTAASRLERAADDEALLLSEIEELTACKERQEKNLFAVKKAAEYLVEAKENLTSRYLGRTRASFLKYLSLFGVSEGEEFDLDTSFEVRRRVLGTPREVEAFSAGTRTLYNLAIRLALVDSLLDGEEPFLIFDDPFASLDTDNLKRVLAALEALCTHRQIIYFTCHASRMP
ncbi:MAG: AAA family ATPase [Clostridia bacterium]|nr:AAA family ATPase [Clostridia bacterium]